VSSDQLAWHHVSRIYGPLVYDWLRTIGTAAQDAPDVCQNVFTSVFLGLPKFREQGGKFRNWLWVITKRKAIDWHRRQKKQPCTVGSETWNCIEDTLDCIISEPSDATASGIPVGVCTRALELVRDRFEPDTLRMACLVIIERHTAADVALLFGTSVAAVYQAKSRVLAALRELLNGFES
jgi:RNA polymerase sigma-70 factor (ECF subfamily)